VNAYRYLLVLSACMAVTLPLELAVGARVYRRPWRLAATLIPVVLVFAAWDGFGVWRGDWRFTPAYVVGIRIAGLPIEEWLFFVIVPLCAVLTFEALGSRRSAPPLPPSSVGEPQPVGRHGR
jgi:lycopene cyclase domain-containing protein